MSVRSVLRAKYDYRPEDSSTTYELAFKEKEIIFLLVQDESGWAKGKNSSGETGWFPLEFTELVYVVPADGSVPAEYGDPNVPARPAASSQPAAAADAAASVSPAAVASVPAQQSPTQSDLPTPAPAAAQPPTQPDPQTPAADAVQSTVAKPPAVGEATSAPQTWTSVVPGHANASVGSVVLGAPGGQTRRERSGTSDSDGSGLDLNGSEKSRSMSSSDDPDSEISNGGEVAGEQRTNDPRQNVVLELLATERTYVANLNTVIVTWMNPLREGNIIETKFLPKIFCNVEQIFHVHRKFLARLGQRIEESTDTQIIGDVFLSTVSEFSVYEEYLTNHHTAIATVNSLARDRKNFAAWLQTVQKQKECNRMDLLSFLIAPVQRILRYKLLMEDLRKRTPIDHPDAANIEDVLQKIAHIAQSINDNIRAQENFQKLCSIQQSFQGSMKSIVVDGRKFVREGPVMKICRKTEKPRWFFLFSDVLVYASVVTLPGAKTDMRGSSAQMSTRQPGTGGTVNSFQRYLYHRMLSLETTRVKELPDTPTMRNAFQIMTQDVKSFVVYTSTAAEKDAWLKDFYDVTHGVWLPPTCPPVLYVAPTVCGSLPPAHPCFTWPRSLVGYPRAAAPGHATVVSAA
eukprot:TRINITY_DN3949_c0_g2_i1.p1 TRINITY_DN3949_c0_g2~~TRINITY_DN3949_c0_g2_i1.p1  ORF type:complete len:630 (+),score=205.90 TRINITY_DN3949_c0_g2_i1:159-2048(+)